MSEQQEWETNGDRVFAVDGPLIATCETPLIAERLVQEHRDLHDLRNQLNPLTLEVEAFRREIGALIKEWEEWEGVVNATNTREVRGAVQRWLPRLKKLIEH